MLAFIITSQRRFAKIAAQATTFQKAYDETAGPPYMAYCYFAIISRDTRDLLEIILISQ